MQSFATGAEIQSRILNGAPAVSTNLTSSINTALCAARKGLTMEIKRRLQLCILLHNGQADLAKEFYETHDYTHTEIYLKGVEALKQEEKKRK